MLISVIIPSRNRFSYVLDLLHDLSQQESPADEIIVVDQSDEPYSNLPCTHIVDSGRGPSRARNLGFKNASGEIIVFLDDDVHIESNFLQQLCTPIINAKSKVVVGAICDENGQYKNQTNSHWKKNYRNWIISLTSNPDFPGNCPTLSFPSGCAAIHWDVYEKVGDFDEFFDPNGAGEDRDYAMRIFSAGFNILFNGSAKLFHLSAPTGGRKDAVEENDQHFGFTPLEANSYYLIAKHFGATALQQEIILKKAYYLTQLITINPKIFFRSIKKIINFKKLSRRMNFILKENNY